MFVAISLHYFIYVLAGYPASLGFPPTLPPSLTPSHPTSVHHVWGERSLPLALIHILASELSLAPIREIAR